MKNTFRLLSFLILACAILSSAGCVSGVIGRSAGGDLIWWCDKCQCEVGSPSTHVCGKTKYDYATKKDVPLDGVASSEIEELLRKDREARSGKPAAYVDSSGKKKWQFWKKSKNSVTPVDGNSKREVNKPYWENKSAASDYNNHAQPQPQGKKKWQFWKKAPAAPEEKYLPPAPKLLKGSLSGNSGKNKV